jgi:hypothetical protein
MCPVSGHRKNHATPSGPGHFYSHTGNFILSISRVQKIGGGVTWFHNRAGGGFLPGKGEGKKTHPQEPACAGESLRWLYVKGGGFGVWAFFLPVPRS